MLADADRSAIGRLAEQYRVRRLVHFGSGARPDGESNDIDLAVEGLPPGLFFRFYSDLAFALSKPVDLVDLTRDTPFNRLIRAEGVTLYGRPS